MIIKLDKTGSINGFQDILTQVSSDTRTKGILIMACDNNGYTHESIDEILHSIPQPLFGGVFPAIIHDLQMLRQGVIVAGFTKEIDVHIVPDLSNKTIDFDEVVSEIFPQRVKAKTMFVFVDGYSTGINSLIEAFFNVLGLGLNYIGGGAGSINPDALEMQKTPCLFTNAGLIKDSAILALTDSQSGVGVRHGWEKISGPYKITETEGNVVKSIDWKPAFEVYSNIVKEHSGKTITRENFFDMAKCYPFGMPKLSKSESIVRDPFSVNDENSLILATEIPRESFIDVLTGDPESIVQAAHKAYHCADDMYKGISAEKTILLIDCISRALFLGDNFKDEIKAVSEADTPLIGALSLGEIANNGQEYLEFFNKTCVVGMLSD
ncbi:FIST N-terminal domain-containing protein [Desulfococcaceae bacterium HSG7]|nr:FIST N-terminal domain-containing protein [Desulfococcaceae bacterium HSG7]